MVCMAQASGIDYTPNPFAQRSTGGSDEGGKLLSRRRVPWHVVGGAVFAVLVIIVIIVIAIRSSGGTSAKVIMKVGEERIFQRDLNLAYAYVEDKNEEAIQQTLDHLAKDSIILQAAQAEGIISLDDDVFDAFNKDYVKRYDLLEQVRTEVEARSDHVRGKAVTVWFMNEVPAKPGYEEGRRIAEEKITTLHEQVVAGDMTMTDAAENIRNDTSLVELDINYDGNALFIIEGNRQGGALTGFPAINELMWTLPIGEVSDIITVKNNQGEDIFFAFAQVDERNLSPQQIGTFNEWYNLHKENYEIQTL